MECPASFSYVLHLPFCLSPCDLLLALPGHGPGLLHQVDTGHERRGMRIVGVAEMLVCAWSLLDPAWCFSTMVTCTESPHVLELGNCPGTFSRLTLPLTWGEKNGRCGKFSEPSRTIQNIPEPWVLYSCCTTPIPFHAERKRHKRPKFCHHRALRSTYVTPLASHWALGQFEETACWLMRVRENGERLCDFCGAV